MLATLSRVDLPTLGKPTRPISASSFSSRVMSWLSPGRPGFAKRGTWRVGVAKCMLPQPPRPPLAASQSSPVDMSCMMAPVSVSRIMVPRGTFI